MRPTLKALQEGSSRGNLQVSITALNRPIQGATVTISYTGEPDRVIERLTSNSSGQTEVVSLPTPPIELSLSPGMEQPYSEYTIQVLAEGYEPFDVSGTEILQDTTSVQPVRLNPITDQNKEQNIVIPAHTLYGDYPPKIAEAEIKPVGEPGEIVLSRVVVPEYIIVHDGAPTDSTAMDYYVTYKDYIKNVASSEIYATWPDAAIRANILAIMSFTMNRVYTEWYRNA